MKAGFVALVGRSNVGKSTLMNALVGTKVAIMSPKPQTTRHAIHGVLNDDRGQIVFVDTPGIFEKSQNAITDILNKRAREAVEGVDVLVYVADPSRPIGNEEKIVLRLIEPLKVKKILVINKIDLYEPPYIEEFRALAPRFDQVVESSALHNNNLQVITDFLFENLPEGEPPYPDSSPNTMDQKQWISELIREKIFIQLHQEIPYSTGVEILEIEERKDNKNKPILFIEANILTNDKRHKGIIIGKGGQKIKEIGQAVRKELELSFNRRVFVKLEVEIDEHWHERLL